MDFTHKYILSVSESCCRKYTWSNAVKTNCYSLLYLCGKEWPMLKASKQTNYVKVSLNQIYELTFSCSAQILPSSLWFQKFPIFQDNAFQLFHLISKISLPLLVPLNNLMYPSLFFHKCLLHNNLMYSNFSFLNACNITQPHSYCCSLP